MNIIESEARANLLAEKEKLGLGDYRRQCLQALKLKTVIKVCLPSALGRDVGKSWWAIHMQHLHSVKMYQDMPLQLIKGWSKLWKQESHGGPVTAMHFNNVDPECANLFASVGGDQAGYSLTIEAFFLSPSNSSGLQREDLHTVIWIQIHLPFSARQCSRGFVYIFQDASSKRAHNQSMRADDEICGRLLSMMTCIWETRLGLWCITQMRRLSIRQEGWAIVKTSCIGCPCSSHSLGEHSQSLACMIPDLTSY